MHYFFIFFLAVSALVAHEEQPLELCTDEVLVVPSNPENGKRILTKYGRTRAWKGLQAVVKVSVPQNSRTKKEFDKFVDSMWHNGDIIGMTYVYKQKSTRIYHSPFVSFFSMEFDMMEKAYKDAIEGIMLVSASPHHEGIIFAYDERKCRLWHTEGLHEMTKKVKALYGAILDLP